MDVYGVCGLNLHLIVKTDVRRNATCLKSSKTSQLVDFVGLELG